MSARVHEWVKRRDGEERARATRTKTSESRGLIRARARYPKRLLHGRSLFSSLVQAREPFNRWKGRHRGLASRYCLSFCTTAFGPPSRTVCCRGSQCIAMRFARCDSTRVPRVSKEYRVGIQRPLPKCYISRTSQRIVRRTTGAVSLWAIFPTFAIPLREGRVPP